MAEPTPPPVSPLDISARSVLKGTLVSLPSQAGPNQFQEAHALAKYAAVRQLALAPGETDSLSGTLRAGERAGQQGPRVSAATLDVLRSFEQPTIPALRPGIAQVATVSSAELGLFAQALIDARLESIRSPYMTRQAPSLIEGTTRALNSAVVAARGLAVNVAVQPLGMLNLERIEMVPAGIQRGELIATVPLAPGEQTAVTHKEWSVTSKEFTTIVTDSLEQTSETGVTDNTDLSQSTTSQNQHSVQFNITATVQGGIPIISGSSTGGVTAQDANSNSATDSIKHATSITNSASSRSRQEHKTTISTTTVTGTSETSTRMLQNTSLTDPIRIDYFSLMRTWRVRLYRYGLRLTYDLVIPEPAGAMRRAYMELENLRNQLGPFVFDVQYTSINNDIVDSKGAPAAPLPGGPGRPRYEWLADQHGVAVPPYPAEPSPIYPSVRGDGNRDWSFLDLEFAVPSGTRILEIHVSTIIGYNDNNPQFKVLGARVEPSWLGTHSDISLVDWFVLAPDGTPFMHGGTGQQKVSFWFWYSSTIWVGLKVILENTPDVIEQWRADVFNALYTAAQTNYYAQQQDIAARVAAIEEKLTNVDTLTLRREESDEVMKSVLKFVLGSDFDFMPANVHQIFKAAGVDLDHGVGFDGPTLGMTKDQWSVLSQHEDLVRFINQAIEWENVVTFLYSYFWDLPESWAFIRELQHPDPNRQAFLRSGSARVVLTVRRGWEAQWMKFVQEGVIDSQLASPATGPYLSIAQEIAAYDSRNYPGIAPADPAESAVRLQDAVFTTSSDTVTPSTAPVPIALASSAGIVVGLEVVIDSEDERHVQESVVVLEVPDSTHIIVAALLHPHGGASGPFAVLQPGDKGALIAEWFEYTPSSGTDIAVTSNLATIA